MKSKLIFATLIAVMLQGCSLGSTKPLLEAPGKQALLTANCPPLSPLSSDTFAATTLKLIEVATTYRECRAAAIGQTPEGKTK